jgi:hypothetical protein
VSIEDGVRRTVEWTQAHRGLIERCIAQHAKLMAQATG